MLFLNKSPDLSAVEMDIYRYISDNLDIIPNIKIRELANATHTSTSTILRLCRKFECDGFAEFKIKLRLFLEDEQNDSIEINDETAYIDFFKRTAHDSFSKNIKQAVSLLKSKELVLFIGMGSSNIIAEYGSLYFSSIFKMALRIEDPLNHPIHHFSKKLSEKICIIALSVSGENTEIIHYLKDQNICNCSIISITNSSKSTIAQLSDVNIPYYITREQINGADITSQVPALYTVECLAKEMRKKD